MNAPRPPEEADREVDTDGDAVRVVGATLTGLAVEPGARKVRLRDSVLVDADLSNVHARFAALRRVELQRCRLVGLELVEAEVEDVLFSDGTLMLGSLGHARLHRVRFEGMNLREASFVGADLRHVEFVDCALEGADFRDARCTKVVIRGTTLDGVVGITSLKGVAMPADDLVASATTLAAALGIELDDASTQ